MLNNNACFPYPVLRRKPEDYKTAVFNDEHTIEAGIDCFHVRTNFSVNNDQICELIDQGKMGYALYISCPSTMYRRLEFVQAIEDYKISAGDVHFRVEVTPCIIVKKVLDHFSVDDFVDDFQPIEFNLAVGDIAGIGSEHSFDALYDPDIIKEGSSPIDVSESNVQFMEVSFEQSHIIVKLPEEQYRNYKGCKGITGKYNMLNSIIVIPVLVQAIGIVAEQESAKESTYSEYAWYNTLKQKLKQITKNDNDYTNMLEHPLTAAEKIMANISGKALLQVNEGEI